MSLGEGQWLKLAIKNAIVLKARLVTVQNIWNQLQSDWMVDFTLTRVVLVTQKEWIYK